MRVSSLCVRPTARAWKMEDCQAARSNEDSSLTATFRRGAIVALRYAPHLKGLVSKPRGTLH